MRRSATPPARFSSSFNPAAPTGGIPRSQYDYAQTLRLSEWRVVWEVVVRGTLDKLIDAVRQNAATAWTLLPMVEALAHHTVLSNLLVAMGNDAVKAMDLLERFGMGGHAKKYPVQIEAAVETCDALWLLGWDRDESNQPTPGARVQKVFDLMERGLAWRERITGAPEYQRVLAEIHALFPRL